VDQDTFACRSQDKAAAARERGRFDSEITPVTIPSSGKGKEPIEFARDEFLRPDTTIEKLAKLKPAFRTDGKGL
jgi:acetyl-CoA acetyltransferase